MSNLRTQRENMVNDRIRACGISDARVLQAMRAVPREQFVSAEFQEFAYADTPLPIGGGQTISQPFIVARMIEALTLTGSERVLEVGTGSGYAAAVLAEVAAVVYTIERDEKLARKAAKRLDRLGYANAHVCAADGSLGWSDEAPFDAILVSAGAPAVPESLKAQLGIGGRLVIPVGRERRSQELVRVTRLDETTFHGEYLASVRFVPLIGAEGWKSNDHAA